MYGDISMKMTKPNYLLIMAVEEEVERHCGIDGSGRWSLVLRFDLPRKLNYGLLKHDCIIDFSMYSQ
jgi:hypothetical protein